MPSKTAHAHWIPLGLRQESAVPPEPAVELTCAFFMPQPIARTPLANAKGDVRKSKQGARSPPLAVQSLGYKLSGAAGIKTFQYCSSSLAL